MRAILLMCFLGVAVAGGAVAVAGGAGDRGMPSRRELIKRIIVLEKESKALKTALDVDKRRSNARNLLLAEWFDDYHPRNGNSRYHRNQVEWKKR